MIIGYARVSTSDQDTALQLDALEAAGLRIYQEAGSGGIKNALNELTKCLDTVREGDTLIVWRLDRLGRSLKDLAEIITELEGRRLQITNGNHRYHQRRWKTHFSYLRWFS